MKKKLYDIEVKARFQIWASDDLKAQDLVLTLLDKHLCDMLDCSYVEEARVTMNADNPKTLGIIKA